MLAYHVDPPRHGSVASHEEKIYLVFLSCPYLYFLNFLVIFKNFLHVHFVSQNKLKVNNTQKHQTIRNTTKTKILHLIHSTKVKIWVTVFEVQVF